ncbi:MAG TPA: cytochrome c biogenesis protein CcdA [Clostridia bacterium]|nr:cytochrome c biogenesis protein CcdA [Clostridia bacterium]
MVVLVPMMSAQDDEDGEPVTWSLSAPSKTTLKLGEKLNARLTAKIAEGWHLYSISQPPGGPTITRITVPSTQPFKLAGVVRGPVPHTKFDQNFNLDTEYYETKAAFTVPVQVSANAPQGKTKLKVEVLFQACNDRRCTIPLTVAVEAPVTIGAGSTAQVDEERPGTEAAAASTSSQPPSPPADGVQGAVSSEPAPSSGSETPVSPNDKQPSAAGQQSIGSFIWLAIVMGALSLLTPCVFPMVPITVSYFTNHSAGSRKSAVGTALIYSIGIILTFTGLGMLLALVVGAGSVNVFAANPWVNLLITAIFLGFAFSLFGAYFIQVPPSLMSKLSRISRNKEGGGIIGALLMGFTFTLTSFTCTAPFVGTLLVMAAQGNWRWPLVGMLAFSSVFALPFFLLALAPQMLSQLPKSGGWLNSIKVVMGFLEIAAAMKFLSNADLVWHWGIFTREFVLATWIGIGILMVLYVLGRVQFAHDTPSDHVSAPRIAIAIVFLAVTIYLVPGLLGKRLGELDSFLPPATQETSASAAVGTPVKSADSWLVDDYEGALAAAKREQKLVFVDFTGYTCTNCRWMEANMFPRPEIERELQKHVRVRLYTDGEGEIYKRHQKMQQERFGSVALPFYALLNADGSKVATFAGLTRDPAEFAAFLQRAQAPQGK